MACSNRPRPNPLRPAGRVGRLLPCPPGGAGRKSRWWAVSRPPYGGKFPRPPRPDRRADKRSASAERRASTDGGRAFDLSARRAPVVMLDREPRCSGEDLQASVCDFLRVATVRNTVWLLLLLVQVPISPCCGASNVSKWCIRRCDRTESPGSSWCASRPVFLFVLWKSKTCATNRWMNF